MEQTQLRLFKTQGIALQTHATEVLFGGGAGGGKSHLLRVAAIAWALQVPGLRVGLFRRLYPDLRANHMESTNGFPAMLAAGVNEGWCEIVRDEIRFWNGSRIDLNHCQHEKDKFRYQGAEFHCLLLDEVTHFTDSIYRFLRSRVRMAGIELPKGLAGRFPRILAGGNPGGVGHHWVKKTWIEHGPMTTHRAPEDEGGMLRQFIPSKLTDNPAMAKNDPAYASRLMGLGDPQLVRAMLDGDWDVVAGAMFGEVWRKDRHTCQPFAVPVDWPIWRGGDDGYADPSCVVWMTQHPQTQTIYVIAELHVTGVLAPELAKQILEIDAAIPRWENGRVVRNQAEISGLYDCSAWDDRGLEAITRGKQLQNAGVKIQPVEKWNGSRVHGCQNMHRLLAPNPRDPKGGPGLVFFTRCTNCIQQIPALPRDPKNNEDVDTTGDDHAYDAVRYGLQWVIRRARTIRTTGT